MTRRLPALAFALGSALAACGRGSDSSVTSDPPRASASEELGAPPPVEPPESKAAPMPRSARGRMEAARAQNDECVSCHPDEAAEWRSSRHARAYENPAFHRGFAREPKSFCADCHAPESEPGRPVARAAAALGVACVTCHVTEPGFVLAGPSRRDDATEARARAAHPLRRSEEFAKVGGCAGCHEFRFPGQWGDGDESFMQTTVREHERSSTASSGCPSCHMPLRDGHPSHAFSQVRQAAWLASHLLARAERSDSGVVITLSQRRAGHAIPTGDIFRRLAVGCEARDARGHVLGHATQYLGRHFGTRYGRWEAKLLEDDRVFYDPRVVELALPAAALRPGARVRWWVRLQRVLMAGSRENRDGSEIESEVEIHSGVIP